MGSQYDNHLSKDEKISIGAELGAMAGGMAATVGILWGGYELGSMINDALHFTNTFGRGVVDFTMIGVLVAGPAYITAGCVGMAIGGAVGAATHSVIEKSRDLGELVSKEYKKIVEKKKGNDRYG